MQVAWARVLAANHEESTAEILYILKSCFFSRLLNDYKRSLLIETHLFGGRFKNIHGAKLFGLYLG